MAQFLAIFLGAVLETLRRLWQKVAGTPPKPIPVRVPAKSYSLLPISRLRFETSLLLPTSSTPRR